MSISREAGPLKWNLNSILAIGGAAVTVITQIVVFTILWTNNSRDVQDLNNQVAAINKRLDTEANERKDRIKDFTKVQTDMQTQIAAYTPLSFQVTQALTLGTENKEANKQTNSRIDRVNENIATKLDNLTLNVNKISESVAVLAAQANKIQKTEFRTPVIDP